MNSRYFPASVLISAASLLLLAGCGSATKRGQVDGVVVRQGRPVGNVVVTFMPDEKSTGGRAQGVTDAQGRFRLRGEDQKEGALVGTYRVIVEDLAIFDAPR